MLNFLELQRKGIQSYILKPRCRLELFSTHKQQPPSPLPSDASDNCRHGNSGPAPAILRRSADPAVRRSPVGRVRLSLPTGPRHEPVPTEPRRTDPGPGWLGDLPAVRGPARGRPDGSPDARATAAPARTAGDRRPNARTHQPTAGDDIVLADEQSVLQSTHEQHKVSTYNVVLMNCGTYELVGGKPQRI